MSHSDRMSFAFPTDAVDFFRELKANNTKEWFADNKDRHKRSVQAPSKEFAEHMTQSLQELADMDLESKIFRIHRDLRFSKDKTPYKPYQHFLFSPPGRGKAGPSFFFALEPDKLILGVGMFEFSKPELDIYRKSVDSVLGEELDGLLTKQLDQGHRLREPSLKKVPRGYASDHPRSELLKRKGLSVWKDLPDVGMANQTGLVDKMVAEYAPLLPVFRWLHQHILAS